MCVGVPIYICVCVCVFLCICACTGLVELWHCEEVTYLAASVVCFD